MAMTLLIDVRRMNMVEDNKQGKTRYEEFRLNGGEILNKVKEIIHQGNVRRIILKDEHGKTSHLTPAQLDELAAYLLSL